MSYIRGGQTTAHELHLAHCRILMALDSLLNVYSKWTSVQLRPLSTV